MNSNVSICSETYYLQNVEILDWRRLDLDPVSLTRVGKCLRELHLQWSGKNTTLRAWSEKEGLAMIPTLETISVTQVEVFKSTISISGLSHSLTCISV